MITRALIFIKHKMPWIWVGIECLNALLFSLMHRKRVSNEVNRAFSEFGLDGYEYRPLAKIDLVALEFLLRAQGAERLRYFQPHGFDIDHLTKALCNPAFLMFGVFSDQHLVGYFFLRCFWNRKCFVGRLIDQPHEGRGIGRVMNQIMYHIAWRSGFHCLTTISKSNAAIMRSHANNPHARVVATLANDYLLVEFVSEKSDVGREALGRG